MTAKRTLLSLLILLLTTPVARADHSLTLAEARRVIRFAVSEAHRLEAPGGAIAVVDAGGHVLALERLDDTFAAAGNISIGKARTAALFRKPTSVFEKIVNDGRTSMTALPDFTPLKGGVPITMNGHVAGAVGVSGAASADQDEEIAEAAAESAGTLQPVAWYDAKQVAKAFTKGDVIFDGTGTNYMVHASRRDRAGEAEVHADDTDVIYVLSGTATFVTGGRVVEPRATAPGEIRGREIAGGETRHLSAGDVVLVPGGTPHWFSEVPGPFTYYVVKVR